MACVIRIRTRESNSGLLKSWLNFWVSFCLPNHRFTWIFFFFFLAICLVETEVFYPCLIRSFFPNYVDIQSASRISSQAFLVICSVQIAPSGPQAPRSTAFPPPSLAAMWPPAQEPLWCSVYRSKRTHSTCPNWWINVSGGWKEMYVKPFV